MSLITALRKGKWRNRDRKSTRLNSSHLGISYAVFCFKKNIGLISFLDLTVLFRLTFVFGKIATPLLADPTLFLILFFFFMNWATTELFLFSLPDGLPI